MKNSPALRTFHTLALLLAAHTLAGAQEHPNAIGWNDGISYRRYVSPSWGIAVSAGVDLQMNDDEANGDSRRFSDYHPGDGLDDESGENTESGLHDDGSRSFHTSVEGFREIRLSKWLQLSPFARTDYQYSWNDAYSSRGSSGTVHSRTTSGEDTSWAAAWSDEQVLKSTRHGVAASIGLRPGILILDRIIIEKEFGLSLRYANIQRESSTMRSSTNRSAGEDASQEIRDIDTWAFHSFGWSDDLFSSIQIHVLF